MVNTATVVSNNIRNLSKKIVSSQATTDSICLLVRCNSLIHQVDRAGMDQSWVATISGTHRGPVDVTHVKSRQGALRLTKHIHNIVQVAGKARGAIMAENKEALS